MITRSLAAVLLSAMSTLVLFTGCTVTPPGGNDNTPELTDQQQAAVDSVVTQMRAVGQTLGGFSALDDVDPQGDGTFGACPAVTVDGQALPAVQITLDYGDGCESTLYPDAAVSGSVTADTAIGSQAVSLTFNAFGVDDEVTSGTAELTRASVNGSTQWTAALDIETTGIGTAEGTITVMFTVTGEDGAASVVIDVPDGTLTLTNVDDDAYDVEVQAIVMAPTANGNFLPEDGTLTFDIPNDGPGPDTITVVIAFTEHSPEDGEVLVSVGGADAVSYHVPGFE